MVLLGSEVEKSCDDRRSPTAREAGCYSLNHMPRMQKPGNCKERRCIALGERPYCAEDKPHGGHELYKHQPVARHDRIARQQRDGIPQPIVSGGDVVDHHRRNEVILECGRVDGPPERIRLLQRVVGEPEGIEPEGSDADGALRGAPQEEVDIDDQE